MINYNIANSKPKNKYLFKAFYNKTNIKKYDLQITQFIVHYTNIIAIKDVIISEKFGEVKMIS